MMTEAQAVANKLGMTFRVSSTSASRAPRKSASTRPSMLQDVEAGREPEIDALVGSVVELGRITGTPTPHIDTVYALVKLLARAMDEEHGRVQMSRMA